MSVSAFHDIIQGPLATFLSLSNNVGGEVAQQAILVGQVFQIQAQFLNNVAQSGNPSAAKRNEILKPTSDKIQAIQSVREQNRASSVFNHLSAISESIPALGWVAVSPAPAPYIKEMNDAGQFYSNRVLKEWKEKDKNHVEWAKSWVEVLTELQKFVKQYHTTGIVWADKASGGPPPPPPPPSMSSLASVEINSGGDDRSALFAQINQGENITHNLKKVTSDMQTHKNANLRTGPAPFKAPSYGSATPKITPVTVKTPVFKQDGKKWIIENHKDNRGLIVEGAEMNNVVYMFGCVNCTLTVKGKINSIFLDSCRKSSVVFDSVVSSAEFVNCQSVQMQVLDKVPTISIDKTDGCQMYLSENSLDVVIVSSKSSEMNVLVPKGGGEYREQAIPEQFKTILSQQVLQTTPVENKG